MPSSGLLLTWQYPAVSNGIPSEALIRGIDPGDVTDLLKDVFE